MRTYTEEEIRAAMEKTVAPNTDAVWFAGKVSDVMAELKRPAIHPDVPVMCDGITKGELWFAKYADKATNIRVLIPVDTMLDAVRSGLAISCAGTSHTGNVMAYVKERIERYQREGK